jgi:DNA mismatch repair protein MutH
MNKNVTGMILAVTALVGFLAVFAFLCFGKVDPANKDLFNIALMALIGWVGMGIGYYLGSSDGSAKKNAAAIAALQLKGGTNETVAQEVPKFTSISDSASTVGD